jgi:hypothetical protein
MRKSSRIQEQRKAQNYLLAVSLSAVNISRINDLKKATLSLNQSCGKGVSKISI